MKATQQIVTVGEGGRVALQVSQPVGSQVRVIRIASCLTNGMNAMPKPGKRLTFPSL